MTTPDKVGALVAATGELLRAQAAGVNAVHLEQAKNQLIVSRVRAAERPYATMEHAAEELMASGAVMPMTETMALIEDIGADEVRGFFNGCWTILLLWRSPAKASPPAARAG